MTVGEHAVDAARREASQHKKLSGVDLTKARNRLLHVLRLYCQAVKKAEGGGAWAVVAVVWRQAWDCFDVSGCGRLAPSDVQEFLHTIGVTPQMEASSGGRSGSAALRCTTTTG